MQHRVHVCWQRVRCVLHVPRTLVGGWGRHRWGEGSILANTGGCGGSQSSHLVLLVGRDKVVVVDWGAMKCGRGAVTVITVWT